jgi:hypothetical protein
MLRIKIELWPFGDESQKREIATMDLWNDGTGDRYDGNYKGVAHTSASVYASKAQVSGEVHKYDRMQSVWALVAKMLKEMGYA